MFLLYFVVRPCRLVFYDGTRMERTATATPCGIKVVYYNRTVVADGKGTKNNPTASSSPQIF
jgi:hypothetical protein